MNDDDGSDGGGGDGSDGETAGKKKELVPGGAQRKVTEENKHE